VSDAVARGRSLDTEGNTMSKKDQGWPPYSTPLRNGNRRLQYKDPVTGKRKSITDLLPAEPKGGYAAKPEAWAAYARLETELIDQRDYSVTVRGFWELWSDPWTSPWRKGVIDGGRRGPNTLRTLKSQTARFVELFGDLPIATINRRDHVKSYLALGTEPGSDQRTIGRTSVTALALMWRDAATEKGGRLVTGNPWAEPAQQVAREDVERREDTGILAPLDWQVADALEAAHSDPYPIGFALWLEFGGETGLRTGELDAVRFDKVRLVQFEDGSEAHVYDVDEQWHAQMREFTHPKWSRKGRTITLTDRAVEILDLARPIAKQFGSPFAFNTKDGKHLSDGYRDRYWTGDKTVVGLRTLVDGLQMKNVTRHYFATTALREYNRQALANEGVPPFALLAEHMGHKDGGTLLRKHYAKTYGDDMQRGMRQFFSNRERQVDELSRQRRRRSA
jgi:hypothetical protein